MDRVSDSAGRRSGKEFRADQALPLQGGRRSVVFTLIMLQRRRQLKMHFLVHSKTIAELEYDSETCLLRVLYKDGRVSSVPDVAPTLVMKIVARVPVEKSPYLMQTAI
ncbi:hypothetical protein RL1182 [Rhizobium johnstonii 3841]|uniref:KTSC domain-containing protein n=2 Tax=Rhizobium TaxID=379 RepID=Q1MK31_RHIJ3|nr:hypothetical protein [Rhizobium leguminosarum]CAK06679.1 hypothetical protein RL1182 [Rhizobium johnstonii 3841]